MALIKHANSELIARDAVVLDLGDLHRQGEQLTALARAQADKLVTEARAERDRILAGAEERGYAKGEAEGREVGVRAGAEQGRSEAITEMKPRLEELEKRWSEALAGFVAQREAMLTAAGTDVVRLAALIAERVTKRVVKLEPSVVVDQLRAVLGVIWRPTELVVRINPDDRALVESALPGLMPVFHAVRQVELEVDPNVERGSCIARTRAGHGGQSGKGGRGGATEVAGEIDASISTQLDRIIEALLPGEDVMPASEPKQSADVPPTEPGAAP